MGGVVVNDNEDGGVVDCGGGRLWCSEGDDGGGAGEDDDGVVEEGGGVVMSAWLAEGGDGEGSGGWWSLKVVAVVSGGRVWGRWGDEAAEERLVAGVWVAGGWPDRVAAPDSGGGRRKPNGRRGER
ncbi:hypothetical protein Tco_1540076 [Tanacetum coccineum]